MLMGSALRTYAPENDEGSEVEDIEDDILDDETEDAEDEIEDDEPDGEDDVDEPPEPRKQTRGENRVAAATRTAAEAKRRADALEAELAEIKRNQNTTSASEMKRQRDEYVATLTGDQKSEFLIREGQQNTERQLQQIRFETYDANDKAEFKDLMAEKPALRAVAAKVEEELQRIRAGGGNVSRAIVAKYVLGDMALNKTTRANNAGAKRAQAGRERSVTRPSSGRGDVAATRSRGGSDLTKLEDRLRDVKL